MRKKSPDDVVDGARMMAVLAEMAPFHKIAASPGEAASLRILQREFEAYGFATTLIRHPAHISIPGRAALAVGDRQFACITHAHALPAPDGVSGAVIDLGWGGEADFDRLDLAGRILLITGLATPGVTRRASRSGAAGVIFVSPDEHRHEMDVSPIWGSPSVETAAELPSVVVVSVNDADGAAIRAMLSRRSDLSATLVAEVDTRWREIPLLEANLVPTQAADAPFVLLSCHHDTWYEGVMDNGAANVAALEAARLCALDVDAMKRGLRVCIWSGHSQGRYAGSAWYVDMHWDELEAKCLAHVNVDSLGGRNATRLEGVGADLELRDLAAEAVRAVTGQVTRGTRLKRYADMSFWGVGIPSMFGLLSEQESGPPGMPNPVGWWWHTAGDTLENIDEANLVRDAQVVLHAVYRLVTEAAVAVDVRPSLDDLVAQLADCAERLPPEIALAEVEASLAALRARLDEMLGRDELSAEAKTALNMRLCRILVPLRNTAGDRFRQDPALPLNQWPVLDALRRFGREGDVSGEHAVSARRSIATLKSAARTMVQEIARA
jgi:hypothetical protein